MNDTGLKNGLVDLRSIDMGGWFIDPWFIDPGNPIILIASALLLVSLLMTLRSCWRRLYPGNPSRAAVVVLINLLAFSTVLILLIDPQRLHQVEQRVMLMTEGADIHAAGLPEPQSVYLSAGIKATPETIQQLKNANWLLDIEQLPLREPALANIDVRGFGLSRNQWQSLPADIRVDFQPPSIDGFTEMSWPRTLVAGETLRLAGRYSNQAAKAVLTLRLLDPAGSVADETRIKNQDHFSLSARPRGHGHLLYTLQAWSGDVLLSEQAVATSVATTSPIKIMVEQSAPSFETRQLKNFAASYGAEVLSNTRISRGKSITQSVNLADGAQITFSPPTLARQDILIMDGRALINLANAQRQWLTDAVTEGLGLLVLADAELLVGFEQLQSSLLAGFELASNPDAQLEAVPRLLSNPASGGQQPLPVTAVHLRASSADILIDDGNGRALVLNKPKGLGHVAISLISQSHRWLTSGGRDHWSDYWAVLIAAVGRSRSDSYLLPQSDNAFHKTGERTPVCVMSATENLVATIIPASTQDRLPAFDIPLSADKLGSPRQCAWFWPRNAGWHEVQLHAKQGGLLLDRQGFFIFGQHQWHAQSRHDRVRATLGRVANNSRHKAGPGTQKWASESLDVFWLYLTLMLSASLLWLERKQFEFQ